MPDSPALAIAESLVQAFGDGAHTAIDAVFHKLTTVEGAALAHDWAGLWARPKQLPPLTEAWRRWGFLTGRGLGKTSAISHWINEEAYAGRAMLICLLAQDEQSSIDIQVLGPTGLIATAHPDFRPVWEASAKQLVWPNGARAYVRTPEVPGKIRGLEYQVAWASEVQSWPVATREEAFDNVEISTRLGYARIIWDATPKRRHPILRRLVADAEQNPERYVLVRGTTHENEANLGEGYVEELQRKFGGTTRGREELLGELLDECATALVRQAWINNARRPLPDRIARRVISIDPAVTNRKGSDTTGIIDFGVGVDGQGLVLGDRSGKHDVGKWADIVLDLYVDGKADLVLAETNKGGQLVVQNLRATATSRNLAVVVVGKDERPRHTHSIVYVKEVYARGAKEDRAEPVGTAYERGRISHVIGVDLASLEDTLTTWEPAPNADSPGDLDALAHAAIELLGLNANAPGGKAGFVGITDMSRALQAPEMKPRPGVPTALSVLSTMRGTDRI